jgi:hypothetical protein
MKKIVLCMMTVAWTSAVLAQDAYDAANIATEDLNGTARYVGMGGALDALGADISTTGSNPAGVGLFRHSEARMTMGVVTQQDAKRANGINPTSVSFDQIGFVWANQISPTSYVNFAFNYHKSRNFKQILRAANSFEAAKTAFNSNGDMTTLIGSGQNVQTLVKGMRGLLDDDMADGNGVNNYESQVDHLYTSLLQFDDGYYPLTASAYDYRRGTKGYIGEYDFTLSGNSNNQIYWGFTVGLHDVHYEGFTSYDEVLESGQYIGNHVSPSKAGLSDERSITGQGIDLKAGIIIRPIETSPFRIGLSVSTPTWYTLKTNNYTTAYVDESRNSSESYKYKFYTPWKFGVSLGHTVDQLLAIGAGYEFTDMSSCDMRYITGHSYDGEDSRSDGEMNEEIGYTLKGVHTLKAGVEMRPDPMLSVRLGYNFVSPVYAGNSEAYRSPRVNSPGVYYASTTDYTNWKSTHRITAGIGTKIDNLSLDLAYQYSVTNGDFFPFSDGEYYRDDTKGVYIENIANAKGVDFKRHQVMLTLGYTF